ncbi:MAG: dihydrolipoamide acetyltransferase family protein [Gemmatimonadaceae bacterium]
MATKVVMEALSPTMEEGRLVKWLKNEGDEIKSGEVLAEVETDKAIMELVARGDGILRKRLANEGDASPVGTLLAVIAPADENIDQIIAQAGGAKAEAPAPAEVAAAGNREPRTGTSEPGTGSPVTAGPPEPRASAQPVATATVASPPLPPPSVGANGRQRSSPLARRLATDRGIELSLVRGSGPGGRIVKKDIESAMAAAASKPKTAAATAPAKRVISREGDYQDVPLTQIRKTIARRLAESLGPIPTFYLTAEFDMVRAAEMRTALKEIGDEFKVSFNDIVIKAVANALADHPEVNAHWMVDHIRYFNRVHVGMAVAIEEGLITPVIFDADRKTLPEISREAKQLAELARNRRLTPEQYTGSTFSVSNLGMLDIDHFTAIINPPETGILAIGAVIEKPVVVDGSIVVRHRMRVTMSCDHRVIDGATGARFLQAVRRLIENPLLLVL